MQPGDIVRQVGAVLEFLRGRTGRKTLARQAGVHFNTIDNVEKGRAENVGLLNVILIAKALGITPSALLAWAERRAHQRGADVKPSDPFRPDELTELRYTWPEQPESQDVVALRPRRHKPRNK